MTCISSLMHQSSTTDASVINIPIMINFVLMKESLLVLQIRNLYPDNAFLKQNYFLNYFFNIDTKKISLKIYIFRRIIFAQISLIWGYHYIKLVIAFPPYILIILLLLDLILNFLL